MKLWTRQPAASRPARNSRAMETAPGVSPCTQIESIGVGRSAPERVTIAPSSSMVSTRATMSCRVVQHGALFPARREASVLGIGAVGENLLRDLEAGPRRRRPLLAARDGEKGQARIDLGDGVGDGLRDLGVALGEIGERAMRLHIADLMPGEPRQSLRRANLIGDGVLDLGGRHGERAAPEARKIGKGDMRADGDAGGFRGAKALRHDFRVPRVKTAGDIGAGDEPQHGRVVAHAPDAKTFAEIGVEIDAAQTVASRAGAERLFRARALGAASSVATPERGRLDGALGAKGDPFGQRGEEAAAVE